MNESSGDVPFFWVDAFTDRKLSGNPCAVLHVNDMPPDATLLQIAQEMGLSETAFVMDSPTDDADFVARYFTPEREIPLAGHPTIATVHSLLAAKRIPIGSPGIRLRLPAGVIPVSIDSAGTRITMQQNRPTFHRRYSPAEIAPIFGLRESDLIAGVPVQTVSTGTPGLLVPVRNLEILLRARMDTAAYLRLRAEGDFFSPHLFTTEGYTPAGQTFAVHFGVSPDTHEDPFTGSATGSMAAFLWKHGLIDLPKFTAEQGHAMGRPGSAQVEVIGPRDAIESVRVGGTAVTLIRGRFEI